MLVNLATQDALLWMNDVIVEDPNTEIDETGGEGGGEDQPFLQVNDRTIYKPPEDAKKGFEEAQKTITSLSGFREVLKELGAPKDADSEYLRGVLTEYIKLAQERKAAATSGKKTTTSNEDD